MPKDVKLDLTQEEIDLIAWAVETRIGQLNEKIEIHSDRIIVSSLRADLDRFCQFMDKIEKAYEEAEER